MTEVMQEPQLNRVFFNRIKLNEGITLRNFIGCLAHYFMLSFIFVSVDLLQPMLLQQKFQIQKKDQIENFRNVTVIGFDIAVKLATSFFFGYLADRTGRVRNNIYGILWIGITMMLMPYTTEFWQYVVLRCLYAQGAISIAVVPLLADYVHHESRGKCAAILVFMSSIGAVASAEINFTILSQLDKQTKLHYQYGVISLLILLIGVCYTTFCLKRGNQYYLQGKQNQRREWREFVQVTKKTLTHPELCTSYISAFLARSDSILLSLYLVLWTYSFNQYDYDTSSTKASALSGITYTIIMFSCIIYGLWYERKNASKRNLMVALLVMAMVGCISINFSTEIDGFMTYVALSVLGIGMSGLLTASLYLVNEYSTPEHRGYITSVQTFFGILGITLQTVIGAVLYEYVSRNGPFNYFAFACAVSIALTILVYRKYGQRKQIQAKDLLSENQISQVSAD